MDTPKKLVVYSINLNNMEKTEMATFVLEGNEVTATYKNPKFKHMIAEGLYDQEKRVTPVDGAKFMVALLRAYALSSTIVVKPG
jgi:hypothetical protein